jgi:hypothetical protein
MTLTATTTPRLTHLQRLEAERSTMREVVAETKSPS